MPIIANWYSNYGPISGDYVPSYCLYSRKSQLIPVIANHIPTIIFQPYSNYIPTIFITIPTNYYNIHEYSINILNSNMIINIH